MSKALQDLYIYCTYSLALLNIVWDFEFVKSVIIFLATMVLLIIQIKVHLKRLKKEDSKDSNSDISKKN